MAMLYNENFPQEVNVVSQQSTSEKRCVRMCANVCMYMCVCVRERERERKREFEERRERE